MFHLLTPKSFNSLKLPLKFLAWCFINENKVVIAVPPIRSGFPDFSLDPDLPGFGPVFTSAFRNLDILTPRVRNLDPLVFLFKEI
jgi:hypothetical protein